MLKEGELPKHKAKRAEFLEYLEATEQNKIRLSNTSQLRSLVILLVIFALVILVLGFSIWTILFALSISAAMYSYFKSKSDLKKIKIMKDKLSSTS